MWWYLCVLVKFARGLLEINLARRSRLILDGINVRHVPGQHPTKTRPCHDCHLLAKANIYIQKKKDLVKKKKPENPDCVHPRKPRLRSPLPFHPPFTSRANALAFSWPTAGQPPSQPYARCPGPGPLPATSCHQVSAVRHPFSSRPAVLNRAPEP